MTTTWLSSKRARTALSLAAYGAYALVFFGSVGSLGPSVAGFVLLPVVFAGLLLGRSGGLWAGLAAWPVNRALFAVATGSPFFTFTATELFWIPLIPAIGVTVGALVDLRARLRSAVEGEREARTRAEANEAALRASEARLRGIIENAPETIIITDTQGVITFTNRTRDVPCALGERLFERAPPDIQAQIHGVLADVVAHGGTRQVDADCHKDGKPLALNVNAGPIRSSGAIEGAIFLISDVTQRRESEAALQRAEQLASLGTLVAGVAHEINNPLTYMRGNIELALLDLEEAAASDDPSRAREASASALASLPAVARGVDRIAHITRSLRRIARPKECARDPIDLNRIAEEALTVASARTPPDVSVIVELSATRRVAGEAPELTQLMTNLIHNAVEAAHGTPGGTVVIRTYDDEDRVVFEVRDNGPGIAPDILAQLFTPFLTTKPDGTGLGLSLSRRIASDHDGDITCASAPGEGATFRFRIPAMKKEALLGP